MSQFRKNNLAAGLLLGLAAAAAEAGIILDEGAVPGVTAPLSNRTLSSIILVPSVGTQPETTYMIQRSMAWQTYRRADASTGAMLVFPPALGGVGSPTSIRQLQIRNHLSRANAYRLNSFRK